MPNPEHSTVYLTKEQLARVHALSIDALVGAQLHTDDSDMTAVRVDLVSIDGQTSRHFVVYTDGSCEETT